MWSIILWLTLLVQLSSTIFVVEFNKLWKPCPKKTNAEFPINASELQIFLSENDVLVMNGRFVTTRDIYPPLGLNIYAQKQEHGDWMPTPYGKQVLNFCPLILSVHEIWYPITQRLNQTHCPYKKGHEETFDMVPLGAWQEEFSDLLKELAGEWRVFTETTLGTVPHLMEVACVMNEVTIIEH